MRVIVGPVERWGFSAVSTGGGNGKVGVLSSHQRRRKWKGGDSQQSAQEEERERSRLSKIWENCEISSM